MYYQIKETIEQIEPKDINPEVLTLGIISPGELEKDYEQFGFTYSNVLDCINNSLHSHGNLDSYQDYLFGIIYGINERQIIRIQDRFGIFIKTNLLLIVVIEDKDGSIRTKVSELLDHVNLTKMSTERLVYGFFERLISTDYVTLEKMESDISAHEDRINEQILDKEFNAQITDIRKDLLLLDNYYQQLISVGEELEENGADLLNEDNLYLFSVFANRVSRLSNNTRMLQEYCVQVREAYHAQLDYDLNRIMKIFTVVTTIFLPLTLIVGWYGMNFTTMPELTWRYGYLFVILLSIIVAFICITYFRKKKFL